MPYPQTLRDRFTDGALDTASGPKIVALCYDRMDRDLAEAIDAIDSGQVERSHELLCHAQDIVHELLCMLDLEVWEHARALASIYRYIIDLLTAANVTKHPTAAIEAKRLLAELGDAFRQAAVSIVAERVASNIVTPERQLSVRA